MAFPPMKGKMPPFEKSAKDKEPRGMREGGRKEERVDARQMRKGPPAKAGKKC